MSAQIHYYRYAVVLSATILTTPVLLVLLHYNRTIQELLKGFELEATRALPLAVALALATQVFWKNADEN